MQLCTSPAHFHDIARYYADHRSWLLQCNAYQHSEFQSFPQLNHSGDLVHKIPHSMWNATTETDTKSDALREIYINYNQDNHGK